MPEKNDQLMEKIIALSKQRGFVYPSSEIYGGMANSWDFGPLGVALKNNIKSFWWKTFVQERMDMVGLETAVIMNPLVWMASGHVKGFADLLVDCKKCRQRFRADHLIEEQAGTDVEGKSPEEVSGIIKEKEIRCPNCQGKEWTEARNFNLLFKTHVGVLEDEKSAAYLRGETAQGMFTDFKLVLGGTRKKIPFGIAQIGKAFRNEVTPGNFIYRTREFEQMEIEYFIRPEDWEKSFEMWAEEMKKFAKNIGLKEENVALHEIPEEKRSHYSQKTVDVEYRYPFGQKELWGLAYRTDYDLGTHERASGHDLKYLDPETNEKYLPHVIEPSFGVERTLLAIMLAAYSEEEIPSADGKTEIRTVLKFPKFLAPVKAAILPLSKKPELEKKAKDIFAALSRHFAADYDETGSIGKRYRRQDEIGTPYCVTVDFETRNDGAATVRDRDTMKQDRVRIEGLEDYLREKLNQ